MAGLIRIQAIGFLSPTLPTPQLQHSMLPEHTFLVCMPYGQCVAHRTPSQPALPFLQAVLGWIESHPNTPAGAQMLRSKCSLQGGDLSLLLPTQPVFLAEISGPGYSGAQLYSSLQNFISIDPKEAYTALQPISHQLEQRMLGQGVQPQDQRPHDLTLAHAATAAKADANCSFFITAVVECARSLPLEDLALLPDKVGNAQ